MPSQSDPNYGWTCKSTRQLTPENTSYGQLLTSDLLPDPAVQRAAGIDPDKWLANGTIATVSSLADAAPVNTLGTPVVAGPSGVFMPITGITGMPPAVATIDWGDGTTGERHNPPYNAGHTYAAPGSYTISVASTNKAGTDTDTAAFKLPALPVVTTATPLTGVAAGGTAITITGTGFQGGGATVKIGGTAATSIVVVSDTSITCASPAKSVGSYPIVVQTAGGIAQNAPVFVYT